MEAFLMCAKCMGHRVMPLEDVRKATTQYMQSRTGESIVVLICVHVRRMVGQGNFRQVLSVQGITEE